MNTKTIRKEVQAARNTESDYALAIGFTIAAIVGLFIAMAIANCVAFINDALSGAF